LEDIKNAELLENIDNHRSLISKFLEYQSKNLNTSKYNTKYRMALFIKSELSETSKTLFTKKIEQWLSWTAHKDLKKLLKNPEESMKTLETVESIAHTPTNHHHYLSAVIAYLRHEKVKGLGEETQNDLMKEWIVIREKNSIPIKEHYLESKPTERQADKADMKWPDILKVRDELPIGQEKLLLGFYTYLNPVRADYFATELIPEGKVAKEPNYILLKDRKVVLTDFKTKGRYEKIEQNIPPELMVILEADLKERPRNYLFNPPTGGDTGYDRKQFSSWACRTLTRVLKHPMTLVVLRHLYISQMDLSKPVKELNETAKNMGHSVSIQKFYEWK
jgi:hypothetical protein